MKLVEKYKRQGKIKGSESPSSKDSKRESESTKYESQSVTSPFTAESNLPQNSVYSPNSPDFMDRKISDESMLTN